MQHVLDALAVDLLVRDEHDARTRSSVSSSTRSARSRIAIWLVEPMLKISPEIVGLVHQALQRPDRVLHVAEAARLRAVAVDLERLAGERVLRRSAGSTIPYWPL